MRSINKVISAALLVLAAHDIRLAPRNAHYYIIGAGGVNDYDYLLDVRAVDPR